MIVRRIAGAVSLLLLVGCATSLTEGGRKIKVTQGPPESLHGCTPLKEVRGEAPSLLYSGENGLFFAMVDARNQAAAVQTADTLLVREAQPHRFGGGVAGVVYRCAGPVERSAPPSQAVAATTAPPADRARENSVKVKPPRDDIFEKARKCQAKGGVWVNDLCVVPID